MRNAVSTVAENHMTEYEQACEHYRQGFRSLFEVCKLYLLFQAALLTVLGVVISRVEFQKVIVICDARLNLPMFFISVIGLSAGFGAIAIAQRFYQYHDACVARAIEIEKMYDMRHMADLHRVWHEGKAYTGVNVALAFFILLAIIWVIGVFNSFGS